MVGFSMVDEMTAASNRVPANPADVTLSDGTRVLLRPVTPADKPRVQEAFRRLSKESRFRRFFTPLERLDGRLLDRLTTADGVDHVVWAALDAENPDDPGLGAASFWRSQHEATEAEFSVTVADEHQGQGIGTLLVATLWLLARELGIERFHLIALADNTPVIAWMESLGATVQRDGIDLRRVTLELSDDPETSLPGTPVGDALLGWLKELDLGTGPRPPTSRS